MDTNKIIEYLKKRKETKFEIRFNYNGARIYWYEYKTNIYISEEKSDKGAILLKKFIKLIIGAELISNDMLFLIKELLEFNYSLTLIYWNKDSYFYNLERI